MTRPTLPSLAITFVAALAAVARAEPPAAGTDPAADAFWDAVASYPDVRAKADAEFARAAADPVAKRDASLASAYAAYQHDHSRPAYDRWVAEAQNALSRRLAPAAGAWLTHMRDFCTHTTDAAVALQGKGAGADQSRLFDRARVGFAHQWTVDSGAFDRRLHDLTSFRPDEPADLDALRAAHPAAFLDETPATQPATRPGPAPLFRPDRPTDVTLWVYEDDNHFDPALHINGRDDTFYRGQLKRASTSPFLTRYEFQLLPTDVLTIGTTDRKTGALAYVLTDRAGRLIAYSRPGLPASPAPGAQDLKQTAQPRPPVWQPAVRVGGRDLRPIRAAAGVPAGLPGDFGCVWVPSSNTGRCTVLAYPPVPPLQ